jgi:hypothetical protein
MILNNYWKMIVQLSKKLTQMRQFHHLSTTFSSSSAVTSQVAGYNQSLLMTPAVGSGGGGGGGNNAFDAVVLHSLDIDKQEDVKKLKKFILSLYDLQQTGSIQPSQLQLQQSMNPKGNEKAGIASQSEQKLIESHPIWNLVSEYRSLVHILPMINSVLSYRKFSRVKGLFNSIGTETGRLIITHPPMQQVS